MGRIEQRLLEAAKLGFNTFVISASHALPTTSRLSHVRIIRCKHISEALKAVLGTGQLSASIDTLAAVLQDPFDEELEVQF